MSKVEYAGAYNPTLSDYLKSNIFVDDNGCWLWQGSINPRGYGNAGLFGDALVAHRLSYLCENGELPPPPLILRHTCDVPSCVNPKHLIPGTHADNARDRSERGRTAKMRGSENGRSKLTESDVMEIRASSETLEELATRYGVGVTTVSHARIGRQWKHLPGARPSKRRVVS